MKQIAFAALGTKWQISIDQENKDCNDSQILTIVSQFENNYSRFNAQSKVSQLNAGKKITVTRELKQLIAFGKELETISGGYFSSNSGTFLKRIGYGTGAQGIDFGAYGKGFLIDKIANHLKKNGNHFFLINAGGDIFATQKSSQNPWIVALEHPLHTDIAIGTVAIKNQALAASSPFKRAWGTHNHLINGKTGEPITEHRATFVLARTAQIADGIATTINIVPKKMITGIARKFLVEFLIFDQGKISMSTNFPAKLFTSTSSE